MLSMACETDIMAQKQIGTILIFSSPVGTKYNQFNIFPCVYPIFCTPAHAHMPFVALKKKFARVCCECLFDHVALILSLLWVVSVSDSAKEPRMETDMSKKKRITS